MGVCENGMEYAIIIVRRRDRKKGKELEKIFILGKIDCPLIFYHHYRKRFTWIKRKI